jgi:hypothetical protein
MTMVTAAIWPALDYSRVSYRLADLRIHPPAGPGLGVTLD